MQFVLALDDTESMKDNINTTEPYYMQELQHVLIFSKIFQRTFYPFFSYLDG